MRLVGYVRVSKVGGREGDSFISPDVQRQRIEQYAQAFGHEVVSWETDLDESGAKTNRPALENAIRAVEIGDVDGIIVAKLDRFARSMAGAIRMLERLEGAGGTLVAADIAMDTSTGTGELLRNLLFSFGQHQLTTIREGFDTARSNAIARGIHITNRPPLGYLRDPETRKLVIDPESASVVREVFRRRAAGESWGAICAWMDEALPRENGKRWVKRSVAGLVEREVYLGVAHSGEARLEGAHEPVVSRHQWDAAQVPKRSRAPSGSKALLAGLVRCAGCGYAMIRTTDGHHYAHYRCRRRHSTGLCPEPAQMSARKLEPAVWEAVRERFRQTDFADQRRAVAARHDEAVARVQAAEGERDKWRSSSLLSKIGEKAFVAGYQEREAALAAARKELAEIPSPTIPEFEPRWDIDQTIAAPRSHKRGDPPATGDEARRVLIEMMVDKVTVARSGSEDDRLRIAWRKML